MGGQTSVVAIEIEGALNEFSRLPGTFHAKDIFWPVGIHCRNPGIILTTISPGRTMRGHVLIKKNNILTLNRKAGRPFRFDEIWRIKNKFSHRFTNYPWLRTGFPNTLIERVRFRIESIQSINDKKERLVLEIVTNGSVSPRNALKESIVSLIRKLARIEERIQDITKPLKFKKRKVKKGF